MAIYQQQDKYDATMWDIIDLADSKLETKMRKDYSYISTALSEHVA